MDLSIERLFLVMVALLTLSRFSSCVVSSSRLLCLKILSSISYYFGVEVVQLVSYLILIVYCIPKIFVDYQ
jgi:hypothetical protein